jgi:hypothetical protein
MRNRFFIWPNPGPSPVEIVPKDYLLRLPITDCRYYVRILQYLDELLPDEGLTFVLTWHRDDFHEVMEDAVILQRGDEEYQKPWYHPRIRAMFKACGLRPNPARDTLRLPPSIAWRCLLRDARDTLIRIRRLLKYGPPGKISTPMYELPLGYFALLDFDPLPVELGCVVVSEPLPFRWYYRNCPAVIIRKWSDLLGVLRNLLNDPAKIKELSRRGRQWWDSTISEEAIAEFIAQRVPRMGCVRQQV